MVLSKNVIDQHLHNLGRMYSRINNFMLKQTFRVLKNYKATINGMLKLDESEVKSNRRLVD